MSKVKASVVKRPATQLFALQQPPGAAATDPENMKVGSPEVGSCEFVVVPEQVDDMVPQSTTP